MLAGIACEASITVIGGTCAWLTDDAVNAIDAVCARWTLLAFWLLGGAVGAWITRSAAGAVARAGLA